MPDFGDWEPSDSFDTAEADPEQVARKFQRFARDEGVDHRDWDDLTDAQQAARLIVFVRLIAWLQRSGHFR